MSRSICHFMAVVVWLLCYIFRVIFACDFLSIIATACKIDLRLRLRFRMTLFSMKPYYLYNETIDFAAMMWGSLANKCVSVFFIYIIVLGMIVFVYLFTYLFIPWIKLPCDVFCTACRISVDKQFPLPIHIPGKYFNFKTFFTSPLFQGYPTKHLAASKPQNVSIKRF